MAKTTISKEEYFALTGLLALARQNKKLVDECEKAMVNITGEDNEYGSLSGDVIWENDLSTVDDLLKRLKIKVDGSKKLHNKGSRKS